MKKIKLYSDLSKTRLPFIKIESGAFKDTYFMLDSGSSDNILFAEAYNRCRDHLVLQSAQTTLYGLDGKPGMAPIAVGAIDIGGMRYKVPFLLVDQKEMTDRMMADQGFPLHGIIGALFMRENGWVIDFSRQQVVVRPRIVW